MSHVLIVGASGRTGRLLVEGARARGHVVTALVRHGASPGLFPPDVVRAEGNVLDAPSLRAAVRGQDAVLCALGPVSSSPPTLCSAGTRYLVEAMEVEGVLRLVIITGALIGHPIEGLGWLYRALRAAGPAAAMEDRHQQEAVVQASALDWTLVRPPRLTDAPPRGRWRAGEAIHLGALAHVARGDLADFMVRQVEDRSLVRRAVSVAY